MKKAAIWVVFLLLLPVLVFVRTGMARDLSVHPFQPSDVICQNQEGEEEDDDGYDVDDSEDDSEDYEDDDSDYSDDDDSYDMENDYDEEIED